LLQRRLVLAERCFVLGDLMIEFGSSDLRQQRSLALLRLP